MVDALVPFAGTFRAGSRAAGPRPMPGWAEAARAAAAAAQATAALRPLKGRARPLAEKSLGTPDPGRHVPGDDLQPCSGYPRGTLAGRGRPQGYSCEPVHAASGHGPVLYSTLTLIRCTTLLPMPW